MKHDYDVFISCKSEDYQLAKVLSKYLSDKGLQCFLADEKIRRSHRAEYGEVIDEALDTAEHLVIVASKPEYFLTPYVKSEWRTFLEEKRAGRKKGNIITVLKETSVESIPIALRKIQSFNYPAFENITAFLPKNDEVIITPTAPDLKAKVDELLSFDRNKNEIYDDFVNTYTGRLTDEIISESRKKIVDTIHKYEHENLQLKRSEFSDLLHNCLTEKTAEYQAKGNDILNEVLKTHFQKISAELGRLVFQIPHSEKLSIDKSNLTVLRGIYDDGSMAKEIEESLARDISDSDMTDIFVASCSIAGLFLSPWLGAAGLAYLAFKKLFSSDASADEIMTLDEIMDMYQKYRTDASIAETTKQKIAEQIGDNQVIRKRIKFILKKYCDNTRKQIEKLA